ncbi:MAG: histidine ammonia-lyase [Planctomycetota bacterium]
MAHSDALILDGSPLTIDQVVAVACENRPVSVDPTVVDRLRSMRTKLDTLTTDGNAYYGINTGFGSLARTRIDADKQRELQANLIRSHAAGVGAPLSADIVRAMMLLLAASLCRGHSGVRPLVAKTILAWLNAGVTPRVPSLGSVGASGDLAPLAHVVLALMGEGPTLDGRTLESAGLKPITLEAKEGLALINGTHLMTGWATLILADYTKIWNAALVANAMSIDAFRASDSYLDARVHNLRNTKEGFAAAAHLRTLLDGSEILPSHKTDDPRVQDPYSFRCSPYVLGSVAELVGNARDAVERELGAVTDNPLLFPSGDSLDVVSAGNFHGMPIAIPLDTLAIGIAHLAGISERRVFAILAASDPETHLLPYLSHGPGLHSGLMIAQYTSAALVNEIAQLASPASVINLPTSAGIEDYNSFGPRSAAKAARALELTENVIAIELICAAEGIEFHRPLKTGPTVEKAIGRIRAVVPTFSEDRSPAPAIEEVAKLIRAGTFDDCISHTHASDAGE